MNIITILIANSQLVLRIAEKLIEISKDLKEFNRIKRLFDKWGQLNRI